MDIIAQAPIQLILFFILYMFYLSKEGEALAVQHPEIPLE